MFPDRFSPSPFGEGRGEVFEVPKTLIFAKTDSHADDIIQIVREEFAEENRFCKKITYKTEEDPKSVLAQFRNDYNPRIAVTVDMIATGTDVKPLECLLFMRDVRSSNYFEQMKGRGTRVIPLDDLKKVTPSAVTVKDHFVIVDAVGVTKSLKIVSRPLEKKPGVPLKDLLGAITVGARDEELFTSLANRLIRLDNQITDKEKAQFTQRTNGKTLKQVVTELLNAYDPDIIEDIKLKVDNEMSTASPVEKEMIISKQHSKLIEAAASTFNGELNTFIDNVRKAHEQIIDIINQDTIEFAGWDTQAKDKAEELVRGFKEWLEANKNEIIALHIFYDQPYRRRELTYTMIKEVLEKLQNDKPALAPLNVWRAYEALGQRNGSPRNELTAIVSLIRKVCGIDKGLVVFDKIVDRNFQNWVFKKQAGTLKFNEEQMQWLRMIKDYVTNSFHIDKDDFDLNPFNAHGGLGKMWQLFGEQTEEIINELNEALAA